MLITVAAAAIALVVELIIETIGQRQRLAAHQQLAQAAEQEISQADATSDEQETGRSDKLTVNLDARIAARYRRARHEAETEVRRYLPTNPRTAKRMMNHVRLAMVIANERGLFRDSVVTQQHLGKWIGIIEQWPSLGAALTTAPARIIDLENAVTLADLQAVLDRIAPGTVASDELRWRMHDGTPLAEILERLVRFEADSIDAIGDDTVGRG